MSKPPDDEPSVDYVRYNRWCNEPCPNCGGPTGLHQGKLPASPCVHSTGCRLTIGDLVAWFEDEAANRIEEG